MINQMNKYIGAILLCASICLAGLEQAHSQVVVNPDGTHSVISGNVIVNPNGTHTVVPGSVIVNPDGTHSVPTGNVIVNPNGTHSVITGNVIINPNGTHSVRSGNLLHPDGTHSVVNGNVSNPFPSAKAQPGERKFRIANIKVYPEFLKEYKAALAEHAEAAVRLEPGVLSLQAVYDQAEPTNVTVFEVYANERAYQRHLKTSHFLKYKNGTLKMVKSLQLVEVAPIGIEIKPEIMK
jgi:quinol monooxygenase YgiN